MEWRAFWGCSMAPNSGIPVGYAKNITLRYLLKAPYSGEGLRFSFTNRYGGEAVSLSAVTVGRYENGRLTDRPVEVTFCGNTSVTLAPGEEIVSDPAKLAVERKGDYAVSIYLQELTRMSNAANCSGPLMRTFATEGNHAEDMVWPEKKVQLWHNNYYFLETAEMLTEEENRSIVTFGDSITAQSWPEWFVLRAMDEGEHTAVIRRGIGGGRILREYTDVTRSCYGESGLHRFAREISTAGADTVLVLHGVNDIIHPDGGVATPLSDLPTAEEMIEGLRYYIQTAHEMDKKIYLSPILPFGGYACPPERNELRKAVNRWIMTQQESDGVLGFEKALQQPENPDYLQSAYDCGDHLHPSLAGARKMAQTVPSELIW